MIKQVDMIQYYVIKITQTVLHRFKIAISRVNKTC